MSIGTPAWLTGADGLDLIVGIRNILERWTHGGGVRCTGQIESEVVRRRERRVLWLDNLVRDAVHARAVDVWATATAVTESEDKVAVILLLDNTRW